MLSDLRFLQLDKNQQKYFRAKAMLKIFSPQKNHQESIYMHNAEKVD
jgi:hypothetical protein